MKGYVRLTLSGLNIAGFFSIFLYLLWQQWVFRNHKKAELNLLFYNNIVSHVMCSTNIPVYKNMTKERTRRQTFVNLVGKFDFHSNQMAPDKVTFIPRIVKGENEHINGFASSIHSLLSPQAVQIPSMRFNNKMTNNILLISNNFFIYVTLRLNRNTPFFFFERSIFSVFSFSFNLSISRKAFTKVFIFILLV